MVIGRDTIRYVFFRQEVRRRKPTLLFIFDSEDGTISAWNGSGPITAVIGVSGCGGANSATNNGTQGGASTLVVTATSGQISHSANIALTVQ